MNALLRILLLVLLAGAPAPALAGAASAEAARQLAFARAEFRAENYDKALKSVSSALILDPQNLEAVLLKALTLEKLRDLDLARSLLEVYGQMAAQRGEPMPEAAELALLRVTGQRKELRARRRAERQAARKAALGLAGGAEPLFEPTSFALLEPVSRTATTYEVRRADSGWTIVASAWFGVTEHTADPDLTPRSTTFTPNPRFRVAGADGTKQPLPAATVSWADDGVEATHPGMTDPFRVSGREVWDSGTWPVRVGARLASGEDRFSFETLNYTAVGYLLILGTRDFVRTEWQVMRTGAMPCGEDQCITAQMTPALPELRTMTLHLLYNEDGQLVQLSQGSFEAAGR